MTDGCDAKQIDQSKATDNPIDFAKAVVRDWLGIEKLNVEFDLGRRHDESTILSVTIENGLFQNKLPKMIDTRVYLT